MTTPDIYRDAEYITDVFTTSSGASGYEYPEDGLVKKAQSNAKVLCIDRLIRDLDILVYCELSALYYMDCSIILFLLRAIIQLIFFTPKAPPFDPTRNQPYIGAIFASNIFCMICHNFFIHPEAGEATRGYLHGGLFIDFIGQKAPVSVFRLLSLDLLIMIIDFVMLGLIVERVKTVDSTAAVAAETQEQQRQDHDSEERGVLQQDSSQAVSSSSPERATGDDGVEHDELGSRDAHTHTHTHNNTTDERTELLADPSENGHDHTKPSHPLDTFASGEFMLMDLGLLDLIRDQWRYSHPSRRTAPTNSSTTTPNSRYVPSPETAAFLRQRFGLQLSADGRVERVEQ